MFMWPLENKATKEQVYEDWKPRKYKTTIDWEPKKKLNFLMVETIQQMQVANHLTDILFTLAREWITSWVGMPSSTKPTESTKS